MTDQGSTTAHPHQEEHRLEVLERSVQVLNLAQQVAHIGSWVWDIQTDHLEWSAEMYRIYGIAPEEFSGDLGEVLARAVHPEDRAILERANQSVVLAGRSEPLEYRVVWPDGTVRTVRGKAGELTLDAEGRPVLLTGIVQDITEQRETENRLRQELALQQLRNAVLEMHDEEDWKRLVVATHELLRGFIPHHALSINLLDRDRGSLRVHYVDVDDPTVRVSSERWLEPPLLAAFEESVDTGRPLYRASRRDPLFAPDLPAEVNSVLDVPFAAGTVAVSATGESAFSPHQVEVLQRFAGVLAQGHRRLVDLRSVEALRQQVSQGQKMQAIGELASGLAHDLNNHLTVIGGYGQLLHRGTQDEAQHQAIAEIRRACDQGATLIRQLLAFSRRQVLRPQLLNLNLLLEDLRRMLARLIGEQIELILDLEPDLGTVLVDEGQLQQVVLNLAVNARDAMPDGGVLTLGTTNRAEDLPDTAENGLRPPGGYVSLVVRDTGIGMDEATRGRIFEPFFTTKERGQGTGLGLATVWGIVAQSGGYITVDSLPERGSTFIVSLPRSEAALPRPLPIQSEPARTAATDQTILVAEDDQALGRLLGRLLEQAGYRVLLAQHGVEAVELARTHRESIDLLVTDVVMPSMDGRTLAETLPGLHPETRLLYISGYPDKVIGRYGVLEPGIRLLAKPFTGDQLLAAVAEALADRQNVDG